MVAFKAFLAVAVVSVAFVQINGKPAELKDSLAEFTGPIQEMFQNVSNSVSKAVDENGQYANTAKKGLNDFFDSFKSELSTLSKTMEGKSGVSDVIKEATKQWHSTVDTYTKNAPELNMKNFNEKFQEALGSITKHATELSKKAQDNVAIDQEIKDFTKKQIEALTEQVKGIQTKLSETKA